VRETSNFSSATTESSATRRRSKMMKASVAADSGAIAFLMEATGASIENVTLALETSGGNEQKALDLLNTDGGGGGATFDAKSDLPQYAPTCKRLHSKQAEVNKPRFKSPNEARRMEDVDDESIAKPARESLTYAPSLMAHVHLHHAPAATDGNYEDGKD
jgi:hypothetical protein